MFHLCPTNVVSKCFMLQVFHEGILSNGRTAQTPADLGVRELGAGSRVLPTRRGGGQGS
jgi:hypothetical protein